MSREVAAIDSASLGEGVTALIPKYAKIAASSSGNNALVAAVEGKKIRVIAYLIIAAGAVNAKFQSDGATTPVDLTGLHYLTTNTGACAPFNPVGWFQSEDGKSLDLNLSAGTAVGGQLVYVEAE